MAEIVGFIGLENMGGPMAKNLARGGFQLVVHDIDPAKVEPLRAEGAKVAGSAQDVAADARRVIWGRTCSTEDGTAVIKVLERLAGVQVGKGVGSA
jgi:3-hydroxyisobutyrate dehydrogenase-like beta-hydroxyacid dehydrogenase